jgi:hypothetical protein
VVERALGDGRLGCSKVLGEDIEPAAIYGDDGLVRADVLVLAHRADGAPPMEGLDALTENVEITALIQEWARVFGASADAIRDTPAQIRDWVLRTEREFRTAANRPALAQRIALEARQSPVQGLLRALSYVPFAMASYPGTLWGLLST